MANDYIVEFDQPVIGPSHLAQTPVAYSRTPLSTRKKASAHGENTEEILIERLDFNWNDIVSLKCKGVIF